MGIDLVEGRDLIVKNGNVYKKTIEGLDASLFFSMMISLILS